VAERETLNRLSRRLSKAGVAASPELVSNLGAYVELLGKWNRKINLTALSVDPLTDDAVDRLIVEPVLAARRVDPGDALVLDVGSGGGSPAIPFLLASPALRLIMVEVKVRKCAFLREALRQLAIERGTVENCRLEELLSRAELHEAADIVTVRAVRPDRRLLNAMQAFLRPGGRLFMFGTESTAKAEFAPPFTSGHTEVLLPASGSQLVIMNKNAKLF
jgi:16S rRNA (guanine527-N7)-methyltransferase